MACSNVKTNAKHSRLCEIKYPYTLIAESNNVRATRFRNCTLNSVMVEDKEVVQTLGYEANMDLISIGEFDALMGDNDKFGNYCGLPVQKHQGELCHWETPIAKPNVFHPPFCGLYQHRNVLFLNASGRVNRSKYRIYRYRPSRRKPQ